MTREEALKELKKLDKDPAITPDLYPAFLCYTKDGQLLEYILKETQLVINTVNEGKQKIIKFD